MAMGSARARTDVLPDLPVRVRVGLIVRVWVGLIVRVRVGA